MTPPVPPAPEEGVVPIEDRDAFVLGPVADHANKPSVYHGSPAACAFNAAYDEMEKKYPKRKDQKKAGIDLAVVGWRAVDAKFAALLARLAAAEGAREEAVALLNEARGAVLRYYVNDDLLARIDALTKARG